MQLTGHIVPVWNEDFKDLLFARHPDPYRGFDLIDAEDKNRYNEIGVFVAPGDVFGYLGGHWPELSTKVYQISKMTAGMILPQHVDRYQTYRHNNNIKDIDSIHRIIVFLDNWQPGHYLEVNGEPFVKWQAGDWVCWQGQTPHLAVNLGKEDRYTLQITGIKI